MLFGLWTAMSAGYGVTSLLAGIFVCRTDWAQVTKESVARAEMEMDGEWGEEDGGAEDLNSEGGGGINRSRTPTYQSSRRRKRGGERRKGAVLNLYGGVNACGNDAPFPPSPPLTL